MSFPAVPASTGETDLNETRAISRLKQGDLSGMEVLVRRYQVRAVHAALLIVHDHALAEEIAQNSFFHAAQKISQFDDRRPFGPWFLRSVINAALQEASRQKRLVPLEEQDADEAREVASWLVDPGLCPENLVENESLYQAIWKALDQLPPHQRAAIVMRYLEDYSEAEITQALDRPLTTIKGWLYAARQRLRRLLRHDYFAGSEPQEGDRS